MATKIYSVYSVDHIEIRYANGDIVYNCFSSDGDYMATDLKEFDIYKPIGKVKTSADIDFGAYLKSEDLKNLLPKFYDKHGDGSEWYLFVPDEPFEE